MYATNPQYKELVKMSPYDKKIFNLIRNHMIDIRYTQMYNNTDYELSNDLYDFKENIYFILNDFIKSINNSLIDESSTFTVDMLLKNFLNYFKNIKLLMTNIKDNYDDFLKIWFNDNK